MKLIIKFSILLIPLFGTSQTIERSVIGSSGGTLSGSGSMMTFTTGEVIIGKNNAVGVEVNQGFQQVNLSNSAINNYEAGYSIHLYPNPVTNDIKLHLSSDIQQNLLLHIIDINGKNVSLPISLNWKGNSQQTIEINQLTSGNYFLQFTNDNGEIANTIKMTKE